MRHLLKNKWLLGIIMAFGFMFSLTCCGQQVSAYTGQAYYNCINSSGGRGHISSVQWACEVAVNYACCLWIGSSTGTDTTVYVDEGQATAYATYWGMCTGDHDTAAVNVYVEGDNGSIAGTDYAPRGSWGYPRSSSTTINVSQFISGLTPTTYGSEKHYTRNVNIHRCNAEDRTSCAWQESDVTLVMREANRTLRMKAIDTNGASLSYLMPDKTVTVKSGTYASLTASNLISYGYRKVKWGWSTWSGYWWDDTDLTYGRVLDEDLTIYAVYKLDQKTLTMKAIDQDGNSLSRLVADKTATVINGEYASLTASSLTGYTKKWWGTSTSSNTWWSDIGMTYGEYLYNDEVIYAVYERHEFSGRARVFEGDSTSGTTYKDTGFVQSNNTQTLNMNCLNSGCKATFDLMLKTVRGSAAVSYTVYRSQNGGSNVTQSTYPLYYPAMGGTNIQIYRNGRYESAFTETLLPGQTVCYSVNFYPLGSYSNTTTAKVEACAHANPSKFEGLAKVTTPSGAKTLGWRDSSASDTQNVSGCKLSGCTVTFEHNLRRVSGIGSTPYTITRTSNYTSKTGNATLKNETETFSGIANGTGKQEYSESITLVPGQVVCEILSFKPNNDVVNVASNAQIKVCASALGNAQPDDPRDPATMNDDSYSDAFLDMRVKNPEGPNKYRKYQKNVYAKPGQTLSYRATYNPLLQYAYSVISQKFRLNGSGTIYPTNYVNSSSTLGTLYNTYKGSAYGNWNNSFTVKSDTDSFASPYFQNFNYPNGKTDKRITTNQHRVVTSEVGRNLSETAETNLNSNTQTTPGQITFTADGSNNNVGNVYTANRSSQANAYVPYNYDTKLSIEEKPADVVQDVIYAGEEKEIKYEIDVIPKTNPETTDGSDEQKYATIMRDAISKVIIYRGAEKGPSDGWGSGKTDELCNYFGVVHSESTCFYANEKTETLNPSGNLNGDQHNLQLKMQVPDIKAGLQLCVAVASYPSNSGAATNWNDPEGSHKWRISKSRCFTVAKKPLFEIWGGGVYSGGTIKTSVMMKNNLKGIGNIENGVMVFSSWAEQIVNAQGAANGIASGAATGRANNVAGGGTLERASENYCNNRVPLSIANYASQAFNLCTNQSITGMSGISAVITNKQSLVGTLPNEDSQVYTYSAPVTIGLNNAGDKTVIRYNSNSDITLGASSANKGKTHIIKTTGNVTISGNIDYQGGQYNNMSDIPKVIIYGNNINIACGVSVVKAILIAENVMDTCPYTDINAKPNSNRLTVTGAIIANELYFNRTYGAATGVNSKVAAEIVNYDVSTVLWGRAKSDPGNEHKNLTAVYQHEIAPRY
ncbi:hypothetical protein IJI89_02390 [Candidatus Saccharibacteria bacterium]|nr:hypothetical protein [Candidatus Saccharibacteria bacterium]